MVSGMYLGEIVRLVLKDISKTKAPGVFGTDDISNVLAGHSMPGFCKEELRMLKSICSAVSERASRISAAALAAVITKTDPKLSRAHTIAIDGSVYEKLPGFSVNMRKALKEIFGKSASRITIALAKDGSGRGAAIIAAVAGKGTF
jgi:hexokinase